MNEEKLNSKVLELIGNAEHSDLLLALYKEHYQPCLDEVLQYKGDDQLFTDYSIDGMIPYDEDRVALFAEHHKDLNDLHVEDNINRSSLYTAITCAIGYAIYALNELIMEALEGDRC